MGIQRVCRSSQYFELFVFCLFVGFTFHVLPENTCGVVGYIVLLLAATNSHGGCYWRCCVTNQQFQKQ